MIEKGEGENPPLFTGEQSMMIFKCPGSQSWEGISFDYQIIKDGEIPEGWSKTVFEAHDKASHPVDVDQDGEVTRDEMEQKAKELGLKFDGRTSNAKLLKMIEEAA
jgi:hypothetical protein